jgi:hypothetical protein
MASARFPAGDARAMAEMEAQLSLLLSGEGGRCAFLRSHSYLHFRMAALYRNRAGGEPVSVWTPNGGVRIEYTPDPSGGYISLCSAPIPFCYTND